MKKSAPGTKVLLAIGGASAGTSDFEAISISSIYRKWFARHAVVYLRQYGFDGLDVNWQFPSASYKTHFTRFLGVNCSNQMTYNVFLLFCFSTYIALRRREFILTVINAVKPVSNLESLREDKSFYKRVLVKIQTHKRVKRNAYLEWQCKNCEFSR